MPRRARHLGPGHQQFRLAAPLPSQRHPTPVSLVLKRRNQARRISSTGCYDPTLTPDALPPSQLIRVTPDGIRTSVGGAELRLGNYVLADKATGDVYVAITNADIDNGQVLR